jgi:N-acyl-D-aspartate/D-glutamate deacylase
MGQVVDVDVVVANGAVVDGTGLPRFRADIGIRDGRIVAVSRSADADLHAATRIDATGLVVAPGFVDSNTHADWVLTSPRRDALLASLVAQGVTTVVGGGCGFSPAPVDPRYREDLHGLTGFLHDPEYPFGWTSFGEFSQACRRPDLPVNVALLVGQQALRCAVAGTRPGPLTTRELARLRSLTREALRSGAQGVSGNVGFVPGVYADHAELEVLAEEAAAAGVVLAVHARAYTRLAPAYGLRPGPAHHIRAVRELVGLARRTGVRLQISHLAVAGRRAWPSVDAVLDELDAADADVGFDVIPYPVGVGPLQMIFPPWAVRSLAAGRVDGWTRARIVALAALQRRLIGLGPDDLQLLDSTVPELRPLSGLTFTSIGTRLGCSPAQAQMEIARRTRLAGTVAVHAFSGDATGDAPLRRLLAHPNAAVVSNAALSGTGAANPAAYGAFPRLLGHHAREHRVFPLEEAIRRVTSLPAHRIGLRDVGRIAEHYRADLVLFDPAAISDAGWPEHPAGPPVGIDRVLIAGRSARLREAS